MEAFADEGCGGVQRPLPEETVAGNDLFGEVVGGMGDVVDNGDCVTLRQHHRIRGRGIGGASVVMYERDTMRLMGQRDIVNPGAVAVVGHAVIFLIAESQGVAADGKGESDMHPVLVTRVIVLLHTVDEEEELVIVALGRDTIIEADAVGRGDSDVEIHV